MIPLSYRHDLGKGASAAVHDQDKSTCLGFVEHPFVRPESCTRKMPSWQLYSTVEPCSWPLALSSFERCLHSFRVSAPTAAAFVNWQARRSSVKQSLSRRLGLVEACCPCRLPCTWRLLHGP